MAGGGYGLLRPPAGLLEKAGACGLRSLFVGFETLNPEALRAQRKAQNLHRDYGAAIRALHDLGVMVNGSFVFGMDEDDHSVSIAPWSGQHRERRRDGDVPHPHALSGHGLFQRMEADGRILHRDWDLYDTVTSSSAHGAMSAEALESGYWRAYQDFYRWGAIFRGAWTKETAGGRLPPRGVCRRLEEVRAALGLRDQTPPHLPAAARARERPVRVWPASCGRAASLEDRAKRSSRAGRGEHAGPWRSVTVARRARFWLTLFHRRARAERASRLCRSSGSCPAHARWAGPGTRIGVRGRTWLPGSPLVSHGVRETGQRFPFFFYGTDWLAFAHFAMP